MWKIGDIVTFDDGLIMGEIIEIDGDFVTIEEISGFSVTRKIDMID